MVAVRHTFWILTYHIFLLSSSGLGVSKDISSPTERVLAALAKALKFFDINKCEINLDGIYGLRVAEGQLKLIIHNHGHLKEEQPTLWHKVRVLSKSAADTAKTSMHCLKKSNALYFKHFKPVVDKPFTTQFKSRHNKIVQVNKEAEETTYDELKGDRCFVDLFGTGEKQKCSISSECWKLMTNFKSKHFRKYVATHSLLFVVMIKRMGCEKHISKFLSSGRSIPNIEQQICDHIYSEARALTRHRHVNVGYRDIFLEQVTVCGDIGFIDFVRSDWMEIILGLQDDERGCFGYEPPVFGARKLLFERQLKDGCSSHSSGVGVASLAVYLKVLIDNDGSFPNQRQIEHKHQHQF